MNAAPISYLGLVIAAALVMIPALIAFVLRLGLLSRLAIASLRTVVQLALIGLVLTWVFAHRQWYWAAALVASMVINAGIAAVRRTERRFPGIWLSGLVAVTVSSVLTTFVVVEVVIGTPGWFEARYVIPLLGMVLGNALTGVSLCLDRLMADFAEKRDQIEGWLALGATRWEAARPHVRAAIGTGMIPMLNAMSVVGLVSLPGMMTGQIIAGAPPMQAVKYQIVVMFMLAAATSLAALLAGVAAYRRLVTPKHQLADRLVARHRTS